MRKLTIGVVGNPNCGKTTLFNALTGARQNVGNWPGVTVEKKTGTVDIAGTACELVDLPGVYSLGAASHASEDERVARDYVLSGQADLIVNIVDAANLERNLYLTAQLLEMRIPVVVAVNMMDIAQGRGIAVDVDRLASELDCPVVPLVAARKKGLAELKKAIERMAAAPTVSKVMPAFTPAVEKAVGELASLIGTVTAGRGVGPLRWQAIKLLEGDEGTRALAQALPAGTVDGHLAAIEQAEGEEADILIADARFTLVGGIVKASVRRPRTASRTLSDRIDHIVLNRVLGIPLFLVAMYLMFVFTINIGGAFIDFFDLAGGALLVDGLGGVLTDIGTPDWLVVLIAKGIGGGIQTIGTFIPVIGFLYLFLSFLEDSGYMARAAFVMDRAMRAVGLPGKSFVPLIVGFGCNVPAIMATRTLEHKRDRILTVMMAPFMSCGARLPVYALFAAAFFPIGGQNVVFSLYLIGIAFAVLTGLVLKKTLLKGEASPFVMELPPYHLPRLSSVLRQAGRRLNDFVFRAGRVIVPMVVVLSFLNAVAPDGTFGHEDTSESVLSAGGRAIIPAFEPMGMTEDNWPAAVGIFTGIFAKEAVIGTLNALYGEVAKADAEGSAVDAGSAEATADGTAETAEAPAEDPTLGGKLVAALETIPANLGDLASKAEDPLGLGTVGSEDATKEVGAGTLGAIAQRFDGPAGAYAYMLLILLYLPCVAAVGAIYRETGAKWTLFSAGWTTALSYCSSVVFYQAATFAAHPGSSAWWIGGCLAFVIALVVLMRVFSSPRANDGTLMAAGRA